MGWDACRLFHDLGQTTEMMLGQERLANPFASGLAVVGRQFEVGQVSLKRLCQCRDVLSSDQRPCFTVFEPVRNPAHVEAHDW